MTARQVIHELEALPPDEQAEVIRFAYRLDANRQLTGPELSSLAEKMVQASDPAESALVRDAIMRGFTAPIIPPDAPRSSRQSSPGSSAAFT